jgi:hypothetical protein
MRAVSAVSAHGTVWPNCVAEGLWLILTPNVVKEREGDPLLDRFFLVTSLSWTKLLRHEVLAHWPLMNSLCSAPDLRSCHSNQKPIQ